jgi:hypothetical protein
MLLRHLEVIAIKEEEEPEEMAPEQEAHEALEVNLPKVEPEPP